MTEAPGGDLLVPGSSRLTADLLTAGLVDELRLMVSPVVLGGGTTMLADLGARVPVELAWSTTFASGNVLLCSRPVAGG